MLTQNRETLAQPGESLSTPQAQEVRDPSPFKLVPLPLNFQCGTIPNSGGGGGAPLQLHLDSFHASTSPPPSYHRYAHTSTLLFPESGGSSKEHCLTLGGATDLSLDKPADHHHHEAPAAILGRVAAQR
uniref:Uncharacterized protein n=1 Tax=Oryza rufipogon TaxID=4529 RepID=A0A0E0NWK9_ORYRU